MVTTAVVAQGGVEVGGSADVTFVHGGGQVDADVVVEWDFDNDGDFDGTHEDITSFVVDAETQAGRDWPSQLTGKAGPGQLKLTLRNDDDRFSYFNADSPLNQDGNSLRVGRKIRVRTSDADTPDPILYAKDRFLGSGTLGADEIGNTWTSQTATNVFSRQSDSSGATMATPSSKGGTSTASVHIATVNVGDDDFYLQARWRFIDVDNTVGIVYRFEDTSNYGIAVAWQTPEAGAIELREVNAGVVSTTVSVDTEFRGGDFIGVHVQGATATLHHNGVPVVSDTAFSSSATLVGIYADWRTQRAPSLQEFYAWDRLPTEIAGILWTGDITSVQPSSPATLDKTVTVSAEGVLARPAGQDVSPPNSIGITSGYLGLDSPGSTTGVMVGATLGRAGLLHPPGNLDVGDVTLGSVGLNPGKALDIMRQFEEAELGFLHESPEGFINFDARGARAGAAVDAVFGDTTAGAQFQYQSLELLDWRREIVNRVEAGIAPKLPHVIPFQAENTANPDILIPMPDVGNGAEVGDLFLVVIDSTHGSSGLVWEKPIGWTEYRDAGDNVGRLRIYAKAVEADDIGDDITFYDSSVNGDFVSWQFLVKDFYGDLQQGLVVSDVTGFGGSSVARARAGDNDPAAVFPSWAPDPTAVVAIRGGATGTSISVATSEDDFYAPNGFSDLNIGVCATNSVGLQIAFQNTNEGVIDPSSFEEDALAGFGFNNFDFVETVTIAIRGFAGDPPETQGGQTVVVEDFASQEDHNSIRTHVNAARLFATDADAQAYGEAVLIAFADDRPIFRLGFEATKSAAYRAQAFTRRVGDKIRLVAENDTGFGVNADFYIESIGHRITDAGKRWGVTWELSPA